MEQQAKVAIVGEDHPLCLAGLLHLTEQALGLSSMITCKSFSEVVAALSKSHAPAFVIIELDLPGLQRTIGFRHIVREWPATRILVTGTSCDPDLVLSVLATGVHGYVPKSASSQDMMEAIAATASGHVYVPQALYAGPDRPKEIELRSPARPLTARQEEVLMLLAAGKSNKQIARALSISEGTVKVHVNASFRALGVHNRVSAAAALRSLRREPAKAQNGETTGSSVPSLMMSH